MKNGIIVKQGNGGATRIEIRSKNQAGVLYIVPAEASWVASEEQLHAHSLAGFFTEIMEVDSEEIKKLMHQWGMSFRPLALE